MCTSSTRSMDSTNIIVPVQVKADPAVDCVSEKDLNAMLKHLNTILYEEQLTDERKHEYLQLLRDVLNKIELKEKAKTVKKLETDYAVLQMTCDCRTMSGKFLQPPTTEMIQRAVHSRHPDMQILTSVIEKNYLADFNSTMLQMFVKFKTAADATAMAGVKIVYEEFVYQFSVPQRTYAKRNVYRAIGGYVTELKVIDERLKRIGALPGFKGFPVLPQTMIDAEVFDKSVQTFNEHMKIKSTTDLKRLGYHNESDVKRRCYEYLTFNTKVNKEKRELILQSLLDSRLAVMQKLKSYNQDEFPFTYDITYKG
jgi:hypothetical protein